MHYSEPCPCLSNDPGSARKAKRPKTLDLPAPPVRQWFRRRLLAWYREHGRDLPWRETRDPYRILVSEIMLQQTQVDRVEPKYHEWLRALSHARGAGRRAASPMPSRPGTRSATTCAPAACTRSRARRSTKYGGELPGDEATLRSFKGIGAYTAGAVMSFAFGKRAAILDTNVARVLFRVFVGGGNPRSHAMDKHLWDVSRTVLPHRHVFDFNQALMDFGATLCSARKPMCLLCPLSSKCRAYPFNPAPESGATPQMTPASSSSPRP